MKIKKGWINKWHNECLLHIKLKLKPLEKAAAAAIACKSGPSAQLEKKLRKQRNLEQ